MNSRKLKAAWMAHALGGWLLLTLGSPIYAANADSLTVRITPQDVYPPAAITDLTGTAGGVGQMLLNWTAPDSNNNLTPTRTAAQSYTVRIATYSISSVGSTTTWWTNAQDVTGEPSPSQPGNTDSLLLNGLSTNVTYYAAILSADTGGNNSTLDTNALSPSLQAHVFLPGSQAPNTPTNFVGVALSTTSIQWTWTASANASFYMINNFPNGNLIIQTSATSYIETGLSPNLSISRTITAGNGFGVSSPSPVQSLYSLAAIPANVALSNVGFASLTLDWTRNGNPTSTQFRVERSPDGTNFTPVNLTTNITFNDSNLTPVTTYYYRVSALNGDGLAAGPSITVSTVTRAQVDFVAPGAPSGLKGSRDSTGQAFTLLWDPVAVNQDLTPCTDLVGYHIYRRTSLTGTPTKLTTNPLSVTAFADNISGQTYYYTVTAVDTSDNESTESLFADSSPEVNIIYVGPDGQSSLFMPEEVNDLLRSAYNPYGVPLTIRLNEEPIPSNTEIIRHIKLSLIRTDTNAELPDISFARPRSIVSIGYNTIGGQVAPGAPGTSAGVRAAATTPDRLSIFWFNGVTWVKVGGVLDIVNQALRVRSSFIGHFELRSAAAATSLTLNQGNVYPRLFTPNGDGYNDRVYFVLENPNNSDIRGEITDLVGRHVANMSPLGNTGIGATLSWDGRDESGAYVPSGAYMYKIKGEGKTFTGTVAVAR